MRQLDELSEELDERIESITEGKPFSAHAFRDWQNNPITLVLMLELKKSQVEAASQCVDETEYSNQETLRGFCDGIESVIGWNPLEDE